MTKTEIIKLQNYEQKSEDQKKEEINISGLPFVRKTENKIIFWCVKPSGDYNDDCQTGNTYGELAIRYMKQADSKSLLTWCVLDMPSIKDFSGIEVGFLEFIAEQAVSTNR